MNTIWKIPLKIATEQYVDFPGLANPYDFGEDPNKCMPCTNQVLHVDAQKGELMLWTMVTTDYPMQKGRVTIHGTGADCGYTLKEKYIGTVLLHDGDLVLHVFFDWVSEGEAKRLGL